MVGGRCHCGRRSVAGRWAVVLYYALSQHASLQTCQSFHVKGHEKSRKLMSEKNTENCHLRPVGEGKFINNIFSIISLNINFRQSFGCEVWQKVKSNLSRIRNVLYIYSNLSQVSGRAFNRGLRFILTCRTYDKIFRNGLERERNFSNAKYKLKKLFECQVTESNIVPVLESNSLANTSKKIQYTKLQSMVTENTLLYSFSKYYNFSSGHIPMPYQL